jgi:hypothetical protein
MDAMPDGGKWDLTGNITRLDRTERGTAPWQQRLQLPQKPDRGDRSVSVALGSSQAFN